MPRCGNLRKYIRDSAESKKAEKLSFILPFLILIVEFILLEDALSVGSEGHIILFIIALIIVSFIELILVVREIYNHRLKQEFDRSLTIKLDDFITETKITNVKEIVSQFVDRNPIYDKNRVEVYKVTCQIMQTHKDEIIEKQILLKLTAFVKGSLSDDISDIVQAFLKKHPGYEKYKTVVYEKVCQLLGIKQN